MAFRKREQSEEFNSALTRKDENSFALQPEEPESIWSIANLKKLSKQDIEDRLWAVEEQSILIKWRLWWALRQKFGENDKAFGKHINEMRENSTRPGWPSSSRDISRSVAAGRFCEQHRISDLNGIKIHQGAIYLLSALDDAKVAGKILTEIRRRYVAVDDVRRMINKETVVATIDKSEQYQDPDTEPKGSYKVEIERSVIDGVVNGEPTQIVSQVAIEPTASHDGEITPSLEENSISLMMQVINYEENEEHSSKNDADRRMDMILSLASENASYLTEQQQKDEIKLLVKSYQLGFLKEAGLLQTCAKEISAKGYGK